MGFLGVGLFEIANCSDKVLLEAFADILFPCSFMESVNSSSAFLTWRGCVVGVSSSFKTSQEFSPGYVLSKGFALIIRSFLWVVGSLTGSGILDFSCSSDGSLEPCPDKLSNPLRLPQVFYNQGLSSLCRCVIYVRAEHWPRLIPVGKYTSAHRAGGPTPYKGWVPPARWVSAAAASPGPPTARGGGWTTFRAKIN